MFVVRSVAREWAAICRRNVYFLWVHKLNTIVSVRLANWYVSELSCTKLVLHVTHTRVCVCACACVHNGA